jgi:hypothetical protein
MREQALVSLSAQQESDIRDAVADLLDHVFAEGEVVAWSLAREEVVDSMTSPEEHLVVRLSTSAGDTFWCSVWQPEVPDGHDPRVAAQHLADQLETWLPTSALGWGQDRRVPPP